MQLCFRAEKTRQRLGQEGGIFDWTFGEAPVLQCDDTALVEFQQRPHRGIGPVLPEPAEAAVDGRSGAMEQYQHRAFASQLAGWRQRRRAVCGALIKSRPGAKCPFDVRGHEVRDVAGDVDADNLEGLDGPAAYG